MCAFSSFSASRAFFKIAVGGYLHYACWQQSLYLHLLVNTSDLFQAFTIQVSLYIFKHKTTDYIYFKQNIKKPKASLFMNWQNVYEMMLLFHLSFFVWSLTIQAAVLVVSPEAIILKDVQHSGHLTEDENPWTCRCQSCLLSCAQQQI